MTFKKGQRGGPGRPKGLTNKATNEVKEVVLKTFKAMGGCKAFKEWATKNPNLFYDKFYGKMLPKPIEGSLDLSVDANIDMAIRQIAEDTEPE
jgi:hypothetical protein